MAPNRWQVQKVRGCEDDRLKHVSLPIRDRCRNVRRRRRRAKAAHHHDFSGGCFVDHEHLRWPESCRQPGADGLLQDRRIARLKHLQFLAGRELAEVERAPVAPPAEPVPAPAMQAFAPPRNEPFETAGPFA